MGTEEKKQSKPEINIQLLAMAPNINPEKIFQALPENSAD